jgi:hypothetical protein
VIPTDVAKFVARNFQKSDQDAALRLLESATIHDGSAAGPRLIRCAVVASAGSLEKLQRELEMLKLDYRDVIVAGEYVPKGADLVRVRNLNEPIEDGT